MSVRAIRQFLRSGVWAYLVLLALAVYAFAPLLILVMNSFKSTTEMALNPFGFPGTFRWENYTESWRIGNFGTTMRNSIFLVALSIFGVLLVAFPAAYALARWKPRGHNLMLVFLLLGSTIPIQLYIIPQFIFLTRMDLMNNLVVLSIIYAAKFAPFAGFLLRAFLLSIPREFEEVARVDGASELQVLLRIVVPLALPALLTVGLVTGLRVWNEFALAVTFIQNADLKPISTSLFAFQQRHSTDWGLTNAGAVLTVLPVIIIFLLLQRRFIDGLTQGGVKG